MSLLASPWLAWHRELASTAPAARHALHPCGTDGDMSPVVKAMLYALIPAGVLVGSGAVAAVRRPGRQMTSYLQHFAAGVVLAALTTELLPQIMDRDVPVAAALGFAAGAALMIAVRHVLGGEHGAGDDHAGEDGEDVRGSMVVAVAVDMVIDGLLIGLGFAAGARTGVLLTVALALEVMFLGLSSAGSRASRTLARTALYAGLLLAGTAAGAGLATRLNNPMMEVALAFGAAALIYLVTEELLVEAHEVSETPWSTGAFSAGFLVIMLADMIG